MNSVCENYFPYVYQITYLPTGVKYIGSRYSKQIIGRKPEDDIGVFYFASCRDERFDKWRQIECTSDYKYEVLFIGIGDSLESAKENVVDYEIYLHTLFRVDEDSMFANKARQKKNGFHHSEGGRFGPLSESSKSMMSARKHEMTEHGITVGQLGALRGVETNRRMKGDDYFSEQVKRGHESRKKNGTYDEACKNISQGIKRRLANSGPFTCKKIEVYDSNGKFLFESFQKDISAQLGVSTNIIKKAIDNGGKIVKTHRTNKLFNGREYLLEYTFKLKQKEGEDDE